MEGPCQLSPCLKGASQSASLGTFDTPVPRVLIGPRCRAPRCRRILPPSSTSVTPALPLSRTSLKILQDAADFDCRWYAARCHLLSLPRDARLMWLGAGAVGASDVSRPHEKLALPAPDGPHNQIESRVSHRSGFATMMIATSREVAQPPIWRLG